MLLPVLVLQFRPEAGRADHGDCRTDGERRQGNGLVA